MLAQIKGLDVYTTLRNNGFLINISFLYMHDNYMYIKICHFFKMKFMYKYFTSLKLLYQS